MNQASFSNKKVTGTSLLIFTSIIDPNIPVCTFNPLFFNSSTNQLYNFSASVGGAELLKEGRRPVRQSPYKVN